MQRNTYTIEYTPAGLDYVRRILGQRPFDEAGPIIFEMEKQKAEQDNAPEVPVPPAATAKPNGSGEPAATH